MGVRIPQPAPNSYVFEESRMGKGNYKMSEPCVYCGKGTYTSIFVKDLGKYAPVCTECRDRMERERIDQALTDVKSASDFSTWKMSDMSEAFWTHLIRYQKHPNKRSLGVIQMAFLWACHADHGLSNSFSHAMKWCDIDLSEERRKTLPED